MAQAPSKTMRAVTQLATGIHVALYRISGGNFANRIANLPILLLTTRGRKSGKSYTNPVVYIRDGQDYLIAASAGGTAWHPSWYFNLQSQPDTRIQVGKQQIAVHASITQYDERTRLYQLFKTSSANFIKYEQSTTRVIPVIRLTPV
jgi:F420H(2)-dependent quinone reductase